MEFRLHQEDASLLQTDSPLSHQLSIKSYYPQLDVQTWISAINASHYELVKLIGGLILEVKSTKLPSSLILASCLKDFMQGSFDPINTTEVDIAL